MPVFMLRLFSIGGGERPDNLQQTCCFDAGPIICIPRAHWAGRRLEVGRTGGVPGSGLWHPPGAGDVFEDLKEYLNWNSSRADRQREAARPVRLIGLGSVLAAQANIVPAMRRTTWR